jgi:cytochrome c553
MKALVLCPLVLGFALTAGIAKDPPAPAKVDPNASPATLAEQVCSKCHGAAGIAALDDVPNLAGQQQDYLAKQLREFKGQTRSDPNAVKNMWSIAHDLTDKQIDGLAAHFSEQPPQSQPVEGKAEQIAAGKTIFTGGALAQGVPPCSGCHGADGAGKPMFPRLAGQHVTYLVKQLMVFQGTRGRPGGSVMKAVTHELTPGDITNVAAYLQALPHENAH